MTSNDEEERARGPEDLGGGRGKDAAYLFAAIRRLLALLEKESIDYLAADAGAHWKPLMRLLNELPAIVAAGPDAVAEAAEQLSGLGGISTADNGALWAHAADADARAIPVDTATATAAGDDCTPPWVRDPVTGECVWPGG